MGVGGREAQEGEDKHTLKIDSRIAQWKLTQHCKAIRLLLKK